MLESFSFRVSVDCHGCRISIPLNGLIGSARCYHCGEVNEYSGNFWVRSLPPAVFVMAMSSALGDKHEHAILDDGLHVEFTRGTPGCPQCNAAVDMTALAELAAHGSGSCAACGVGIPVRGADALAIAINSGARYLVSEQALDASGQALQARTKPVVFQCMTCGASLPVDGSKRLVGCQYCNADNYLPDGLWQLFNPVPKPVPFYFVCEYETPAERAARASHTTAADALATLAKDAAPEVRRAVAANPATPAAVLEKLAFDPSRQVLEGLAANPNLPSHIVDEMAHSDDPEFQMLAARHPNLTPGHLPQLTQHADPYVRNEAQARLAALQAQGVYVQPASPPPLKGFFARLFGG